MLNTDEDALVCDLAETYGIYDMRSLPAGLVATFCVGLRDDSRIKIKMSGNNCSVDTLLRAVIADRAGLLLWAQTEDGQKGKNRPISLVSQLTGKANQEQKNNSNLASFNSAEEFKRARNEILRKKKWQ